MILVRIGKASHPRHEPEVGDVYDTPEHVDHNHLEADLILRDEATGQCYLIVHEDQSLLWELRPIG